MRTAKAEIRRPSVDRWGRVTVANEQTKLLANALDRASTAVGIGAVFPLINVINQVEGANPGLFIISFLIFGFWSVVPHYIARPILTGLR
jgi:hypothetical protein